MGTVLVIDFGSQYTHLIARRIRQLNVYSEVRESSIDPTMIEADAVILSGGPSSVYDAGAPRNDALIAYLHEHNIPTLGICYGMPGKKGIRHRHDQYQRGPAFQGP